MRAKWIIGALIVLNAWNSVTAQVTFQMHILDDNTNGAGAVYACDLDGDGDQDVLAAGLEDSKIFWWRNEGGAPLQWTKFTIAHNVGNAHSVHAADYDGDGDFDVIVAAYSGLPGVRLYRNDGGNPINWTQSGIAPSFYNVHEVTTADLNGDGHPDVLGASSDMNAIAWWSNSGTESPSWTQQIIGNSVPLAKSAQPGDLDGDDDLDVIGAAIISNDLMWWRNDGGDPIAWTRFFIDANFIGAHRVQACDLDSDGDLDVLGAGYLGHEVSWWRNDGGDPIQWRKFRIRTGFLNACVAHADDLDGDGDLDVVASAQGHDQVVLWLNNGGNPITWTAITVDSDFERVWPLHTVDLDGDGDTDIIGGTSHRGNGQIRWYENLGTNSVGDNTPKPSQFRLEQNYPNPFNRATIIRWVQDRPSPIHLHLYDCNGRIIRTFSNGDPWVAGAHTIHWSGTDDRGHTVSSGIYHLILSIDDFSESRKILLLK